MSMVLSDMSKLESYEVVVVLAVQEKPSAVHIVPEPNGPAFSAQINFKDCTSQYILRSNLLICFIKKQIYKNCPGKCPKRKGVIPGVTGLPVGHESCRGSGKWQGEGAPNIALIGETDN